MAYSKQNFQNGQILTAANLEAMENGIIAGQGAHNLLDNSDFTNPVNQRGKTSYSTSGNEYTIDRWKTQYNTGLTIENGYINVIGGWQIYQTIKNPKDGVYTFAVEARINSIGDYTPNMDISGKIETSFGSNIGEWKIYTLQYDLSTITDETISLSISARGGNNSGSISVRWAALYKGAYDISTLPPYIPKGKHVEMLNCNISLAPHNLLDNSDFANPVNQRGATSYTGTGGKVYTIDRWHTWSASISVSVQNGYLSITNSTDSIYQNISQIIDKHNLTDKSATIAVWDANGNVYCASGVISKNNEISCSTPADFWFSAILEDDNTIYFAIRPRGAKTANIKAAALYEGSYDASTLPAYQPKGYAAELAEAQRYYQTIPALTHISGVTNTTTSFGAKYRIPTMRIAPTVSIASGQEVSIYTGDYSATTANYTMQYASKINQITFNVSLSAGSFVAYKPGELTFPVDIVLSADL